MARHAVIAQELGVAPPTREASLATVSRIHRGVEPDHLQEALAIAQRVTETSRQRSLGGRFKWYYSGDIALMLLLQAQRHEIFLPQMLRQPNAPTIGSGKVDVTFSGSGESERSESAERLIRPVVRVTFVAVTARHGLPRTVAVPTPVSNGSEHRNGHPRQMPLLQTNEIGTHGIFVVTMPKGQRFAIAHPLNILEERAARQLLHSEEGHKAVGVYAQAKNRFTTLYSALLGTLIPEKILRNTVEGVLDRHTPPHGMKAASDMRSYLEEQRRIHEKLREGGIRL
jgi:hypothetical protein